MSESNSTAPVVMVKKACGKHWGLAPGPCQKCAYFAKLAGDPKHQKAHQHNGTPWCAIYGRKVTTPF